jgi:hypothetical protein
MRGRAAHGIHIQPRGGLQRLDLSGKQGGDPVARTRFRTKSAEITHAAIWPSDLHAPQATLSHNRQNSANVMLLASQMRAARP